MLSAYPGLNINLLMALGLLLLLRSSDNRNNFLRAIFSFLAVFFNIRYLLWRVNSTMDPFLTDFESVWQWGFFCSELIAILLLSWHLLILIAKPREIKADIDTVALKTGDTGPPLVDVFIPTFNEGPELLTETIRAAREIDYPNLQVYVLDDGDRDWLEDMCKEGSVKYMRRSERAGFKAGNLNNALKVAKGEYILCLDADFVVKSSILKRILGYFNDRKIGIVQTPQYFSNRDAIQHNLGGHKAWPEEQRVFTDVMQPCRDNWGNAFCYGTNFVIRREYLDAVDGFPTSTICEDLFLTYKLKKFGWITRYHNEGLAIGQAANTLNEFINQRVRWCTGTLQCLFLKDGPILSSNLSVVDRLFFLDPVMFYLSSIWFFFLMISPAIFWWSGIAPFDTDDGHLLMMLAPRMLVSILVLYWLTSRKVVPVVSEMGRYVAIFHTLMAIATTLVKPFSRSFRVTLKENKRDKTSINWSVLWPHLFVVAVTIAGIIYAVSKGIVSDSGLNENIGLILALTVYTFWVGFLSALACIEPELGHSPVSKEGITTSGSIRHSVLAIIKKVIQ